MKMYAYSNTQAGIARLQQERGQPIAAIEAVREEIAPAVVPVGVPVVADNVVRWMPDARKIIADIAHKHGLNYRDLVGPRRYRHIIPVRDEAIAAVRALSDGRESFSLPMVGRIFGGRDHTSILAALRRHAKRTGT